MKFTITKCKNKLSLVKFFREEIRNITLQEALHFVENLPYSWNDISKAEADDLRRRTADFTDSTIEQDIEDNYSCYNININPPPEFITAMAWYETLSEEEKIYVDQIALWRNRPAVC